MKQLYLNVLTQRLSNQTNTRLLACLFLSLFIAACSAEKKPSIDESGSTKPVEIHTAETPEKIETPKDESNINEVTDFDEPTQATANVVPEEPKIVIPKAKPPLTHKQLFASTLSTHNRVRAKHGLNPLKWSDNLAKYSQQWADHLGAANSCKMYHRSGLPPYGENLYISSATVWSVDNKEVSRERNRVTISNVVKAWADEEKWYNYQRNSCQPGKRCGHYTQIVWRDTTEVGCAMKYCGDKSQTWVCSYNPPGNFKGVRPY